MRWFQYAASPYLTVAVFLLLAGGVIAVIKQWLSPTAAMAVPLALFIVNLTAAIIAKPKLRVDPLLLTFHLALLLLAALFIGARLIYFNGGTVLPEGAVFDGQLVTENRGPLHPGHIDLLRFQNDGFTADYAANQPPNSTYNRVRWWDQAGTDYVSIIGDDRPLVLDQFRIYTTSFRGFAPLFEWHPAQGDIARGSVQLTSQIAGHLQPAAEWQLEAGPKIWVMLELDDTPLIEQTLRGKAPSEAFPHQLVLRVGDQRQLLKPGDRVVLEGGQLTYLRLDTWMGYSIVYEPLTPWMVATVLIGVLTLIGFYLRTLFRPIAKTSKAALKQMELG